MKARKIETGEIVDIIFYNDISTTSVSKYLVSYVDSQGVEHGIEGTDYHLDFEPIDNLTKWQDVRERAAIAAMQGILCAPIVEGIDPNPSKEHIAELAVAQADALIEQLKKK